MEFNDDVEESGQLKGKEIKDDRNNLLGTKIAELENMQENLKKAKDDAMQSWLDSRPLIDELEKMQEELASAKSRIAEANIAISELQAQLETTEMCIKSKKEEEMKYRMLANEQNQALHREQEEMEQLKLKIDRKRRRRTKLKQVLRLKKQTLETLLLTLEAIQLETEAFGISAAQAVRYINNSEDSNTMVQLTQEEYDFLKREAREQTSLAEWRIAVSVEEKIAAENSRDSAFDRLQKLYPRNGSYSQRNKMERTVGDENNTRTRGDSNTGGGRQSNYRRHHSPKARGKVPNGVNKRNQQGQLKNKGKYAIKKRSSFCFQIKSNFIKKLSRCFRGSRI